MTKADLVEAVYNKIGIPKREASDLVDLTFDIVKDTLETGEEVNIQGFGKLKVRQKNPRIGRNPQSGDQLTISARKVVTFKPSQKLREAINEGI